MTLYNDRACCAEASLYVFNVQRRPDAACSGCARKGLGRRDACQPPRLPQLADWQIMVYCRWFVRQLCRGDGSLASLRMDSLFFLSKIIYYDVGLEDIIRRREE